MVCFRWSSTFAFAFLTFVLADFGAMAGLAAGHRRDAWTLCVEKHLEGATFLHERNPDRYKRGDAHRMENILRLAGIDKPGRAQQKLAAWLELAERARHNPERLEKIKTKLISNLVIQPEDADAYFAFQARLARELGHGDVHYTPELRAQLFSTLVTDQKNTLLSWWNYFQSEDSNSYPTWAKIWAFEEMSKLKALEAGETKFNPRSRETQGLFPELNREALAKVMDTVLGRTNSNPRFAELYSQALQNVVATTADLNVTTGTWVKYPRGSAPTDLVRSIDCKGTGWCTAGEKTAEAQLRSGNFYVYYSHDRNGKPTQPRIAIRMNGDRIAEVRGIGKEQHLDAAMAETDILETKLKDFGEEGAMYKKRSSDMKRLTAIEKKHKQGTELTNEELRFLYQIDRPIDGFGYKKDPRIKEIITTRNPRADLAKVLHIEPSKISLTREEALRGGIEIHFGDLDLSDLISGDGIDLPKYVSGNLFLSRLTSAKGLKFPEHVGEDLDLRALISAQYLKLPNRVEGSLHLWDLTSVQSLEFPNHVGGNLSLTGLTSLQGLELRGTIQGFIFISQDVFNRESHLMRQFVGYVFKVG